MHRFCQWPLKSKSVCTSTTISSNILKVKAHHHRFQLTSPWPWCNNTAATDRCVCTSIRLSQSQKNHYEVLGVERLASTIQIREAFLKLSKEFHPDMNANDPQNHQKFVLLNEAYTILSKPLSRRDYDLSLQLEKHLRQNKTSAYHPYGYQAGTPYYHHRNHVDVDWDGMPRHPSSQEKDKFHSGKRLHRILVNYYSLSAFFTIGILAFLLMSKEILVPARKNLQQKDVNMHDFIMTSQHEGRTVLYYAVQDGDNPELFKVLAVSKRQSSNKSDEFEFEELNSV